MLEGRALQPTGVYFGLLVVVLRVPCAAAKGSSDANVILFVGVMSFIFLISAIYVAVSCGYYHLVIRAAQRLEDTVPADAEEEGCGWSNRGSSSSLQDEMTKRIPSTIEGADAAVKIDSPSKSLDLMASGKVGSLDDGHLGDPVAAAQDLSVSCDRCAHEHGLDPADLDFPEGLAPAGVEIDPGSPDGAVSAALRQRPPAQSAGFMNLSNSQEVTILTEGPGPVPRCCTVFDWCSTGSPRLESQGVPPASPMAGPPGSPRAPASVPKGRLRL